MKKANYFVTIILFFSLPLFSSGQHTLKGRVIDASTTSGIVGATVSNLDMTTGGVTDHNSEFTIEFQTKPDSIRISFTGYTTKVVAVTNDYLTIYLEVSVEMLSKAVVTASRSPQSRQDVPVAISTVELRKIREINPNDPSELLDRISGVHYANFGNEQASISIRQPLSFSRSLIVLLEDGIPIGPVSIATSGDMKQINLASVENVEVLRGPASSLYGSEAIGGTVNYSTLNPGKISGGYFNISSSNTGYNRIDFNISNTFKKTGVLLAGYYGVQRDGYREYSDFDKIAFTLKIQQPLCAKSNLTFKANYLDYYSDFASSLDSMQFYTNDKFNEHRFTYTQLNAFRAQMGVDRHWNNKNNSSLTFYYKNLAEEEIPTYLIRTSYFPPPPSTSGELINEDYTVYGALLRHKYDISFWKTVFQVGLSIEYTPLNYISEKINVTKDTNDRYVDFEKSGDCIQDFLADLLNTGTYVSIESRPLPRLTVHLAIRYDRLDYAFDNHLEPGDMSGAPDEENTFDHVSPKIGFTYEIAKNTGAYLSYSTGFAPPLFSQLYKMVEVPRLKPANYANYEFGVWGSYLKNRVYAEVSLYRTNGENEVVTVLLPDGSEETRSTGKTKHEGIEYSVVFKPVNGLELNISGTSAKHSFVEFVDDLYDYSGKEMDIAPNQIWFAGLNYELPFVQGLRIGAEYQYVGPYFMDGLNSEEYQGYDIFNIRASYSYYGFTLWGKVLNVFDELYAARASKSYYNTQYGQISSVKYSPGMHRGIYFGLSYQVNRK